MKGSRKDETIRNARNVLQNAMTAGNELSVICDISISLGMIVDELRKINERAEDSSNGDM